MNTLTKKMAITSLAFTLLLGIGAISISFADNNNEEQKFGMQYEHHGHQEGKGMRGMMKDVTKSVEKTETGVIVTLTSDNTEVVEKLQNHDPKHPKKEGITDSKVNIENGVQITITGDSAELIAEIQSHSEKMNERGERREMKGKQGGMRGMRGMMKDITKSVEKTETGVIVTLTSDNAEVVEKLQNKQARQPKNDSISATKISIENGVQITLSTTDADLVEKIQKRAESKKPHRFTKRR